MPDTVHTAIFAIFFAPLGCATSAAEDDGLETSGPPTESSSGSETSDGEDTRPDPDPSCAPVDAQGRPIASEDPFERHTISVGDDAEAFISYVDEGVGDPVVFIHGAPTSSYLWRNIIPHVADDHRAIAIDLVGYGASGTPADATFRYPEHQEWFANFVDALDLDDITLVVHDIGSIEGFSYAADHPDEIRALVHLESVYFPIPSADILPPQASFIMSAEGQRAIVEDNWFIETMLPGFVERELCPAEVAAYADPWADPARRRVLQIVPLDLPIMGVPEDNQDSFERFGQYLATSDVPKLFLHGAPGALVQDVVPPGAPLSTFDTVSGFPNTTVVDVGPGTHFLQEDHPHEIGEAISDFLDELP